jgi:hypothetical protein
MLAARILEYRRSFNASDPAETHAAQRETEVRGIQGGLRY